MSSVGKGSIFEGRVYEAIREELQSERLGLSPSTAKLFRRKGYYSRDRDAEIIVDLSIEVWPPNASNWSLLWVGECKNYDGTIPVNDVEEFKAKLDQITGANRKGVVITSQALQKSALAYAKSNGIGVARLLPDDRVQWLVHMMTSSSVDDFDRLNAAEFQSALLVPSFLGRNRNFYAAADGYIFGGWDALLRHDLKSTPDHASGRDRGHGRFSSLFQRLRFGHGG